MPDYLVTVMGRRTLRQYRLAETAATPQLAAAAAVNEQVGDDTDGDNEPLIAIQVADAAGTVLWTRSAMPAFRPYRQLILDLQAASTFAALKQALIDWAQRMAGPP